MASERSASKRGPLFALSSDLSLLATCSADSRVKVWDTKSSTLLLDCTALAPPKGLTNEALLGPFTCIAWGLVLGVAPGSKTPGSKKKKNPNSAKPRYLLFSGTPAGDVVAWEPTASRVLWRSNSWRLEDDVTALVASHSTSSSSQATLWAGTRSGTLCEIVAETGEVLSSMSVGKAAITSLALSSDSSKILIGGPSLKLFDLSTRKRVWKVTGHTSPVTCCMFSPDSKFAFSTARNERHVAIWDCSSTDSQSALGTLSTIETVMSFSCQGGTPTTEQNSSSKVKVLLVTTGGDAYLWCAGTSTELPGVSPTVIKQPPTTGSTLGKAGKSSKTSKGAILFAAASGSSEDAVMVVRGTIARPRVEEVVVEPEAGATIFLQALDHGDLLPNGGAGVGFLGSASAGKQKGKAALSTQQHAGEVASANPGAVSAADVDMAEIAMEVEKAEANGPVAEEKNKKKKKRKTVDETGEGAKAGGDAEGPNRAAAGGDAEGPNRAAAEGDGEEDDNQTLEEKLRSLGVSTNEEAGVKREGKAEDMEAPPRADSLLVLLQQAVASEDDKLLEHCLRVEDGSIIANTVRRLQPMTAVKFLSVAVARMQARPNRAKVLAPWLRALCINHAALFMSTPGVQPLLTALFQEVDSRVSLFQPMLSLSGRLDLVVSSIRQIQRRKGGESVKGEGEELAGVAVYDEANEASDLEVEDVTRERGEGEEEDEGEDSESGTDAESEESEEGGDEDMGEEEVEDDGGEEDEEDSESEEEGEDDESED